VPNRTAEIRATKFTVRFNQTEQRQIEAATKAGGYSSPSAFVRAAIRNELDGRPELMGAEQRLAAGFDRVIHEVFRVGRGQQALFALIDALTKTMLTCVPEPPSDARPQAVARGRERYDRLMKSAGRAMVGEIRAAMQDLVSHVAEG
jgi:Arc/MetJ-type ribon-helix-helix transcriptional regulator